MQIASVVVTLCRVEEVTVRVLNLRIRHAVPQNLLVVLCVVQNVHHFGHKALSSYSVLEFEPVRSEVEPIFNFLLIAVAIVSDLFQDLDSFIAVVSGVVDFNEGSAEHSILHDTLVKR